MPSSRLRLWPPLPPPLPPCAQPPLRRRPPRLRAPSPSTASAVALATLDPPVACLPSRARSLTVRHPFLSLNNHLQVLNLRIRRLLLAMRVISSYHSSPAQHTTTSPQTHDPVPHCMSHFPTTTRARRRDKEHGTGWTRFDDRAKTLGASAAVSVFFWLVFSRKLSSVVHV